MHHRMESVATPAPPARFSTGAHQEIKEFGLFDLVMAQPAGRPACAPRQAESRTQGVIHTPPGASGLCDGCRGD